MTQERVYILHKNELRRNFPLTGILGITMSYHKESNEMVIHIKKEFGADMRIISPAHRQHLLDTVKMFYCTKTKTNLPVYGVRQKNLKEYHTSESDHKKGLSRVPLPIARMSTQDLIKLDEFLKNRSFIENIKIQKEMTESVLDRRKLECEERDAQRRLDDLDKNLYDYTEMKRQRRNSQNSSGSNSGSNGAGSADKSQPSVIVDEMN